MHIYIYVYICIYVISIHRRYSHMYTYVYVYIYIYHSNKAHLQRGSEDSTGINVGFCRILYDSKDSIGLYDSLAFSRSLQDSIGFYRIL